MADAIADKKAAGKADPSLCPGELLRQVGAVMVFGASKPGRTPGSWNPPEDATDEQLRATARVFWAALERHVLECKGAVPDPFASDDESGLLHVAHIGANVGMILTLARRLAGRPKTGTPEVSEYEKNLLAVLRTSTPAALRRSDPFDPRRRGLGTAVDSTHICETRDTAGYCTHCGGCF